MTSRKIRMAVNGYCVIGKRIADRALGLKRDFIGSVAQPQLSPA